MINPAERIRELAISAYNPDDSLHREEALFNAISSILTDSANMIMPEWAPFTIKIGKKSTTIHGYEYDEELEILTIIVLLDCHSKFELLQSWDRVNCGPTDVKKAFAQIEKVLDLAREKNLPILDESDSANRFYNFIYQHVKFDVTRISLCLWTSGELSKEGWKKTDVKGFHTEVWDASRLATAMDSGHESLEIDFTPYGGIDLLMDDSDFSNSGAKSGAVLIGKISGECLADVYFQHRTRILQQNVRVFLSKNGPVNKGIITTAVTEPSRFLAYNNGIATTSSRVTLKKKTSGVFTLTRAEDFQIVNGGQTTASLMVAKNDKSADISSVMVPIKLTVVSQKELKDLVPKISRYANTQNKVQDSDFESSNPWLVKLEAISRKVEASKDSKSSGQRLFWYFERVRGQYNVDFHKQKTPAQRNAFKAANPPRTKFTKTDLAVVAMAWDLEPYNSSLGPQKCFSSFSKRLYAAREAMGEGSVCEPSEEDFRRLCCIMILRREALSICREIKINPLLSNSTITAYAISRISHDMRGQLPWGEIWNNQDLPMPLQKALRAALRGCEAIILKEAPKNNKQPSEYAKKSECWADVSAAPIDLHLKEAGLRGLDKFSIMDTVRPAEFVEADSIFFSVDKNEWVRVSAALATHSKNSTYSGCAKTMGDYVVKHKKPSDKQAKILAKGLLLLKRERRCLDILGKIPEPSWLLLEQIGGIRTIQKIDSSER